MKFPVLIVGYWDTLRDLRESEGGST